MPRPTLAKAPTDTHPISHTLQIGWKINAPARDTVAGGGHRLGHQNLSHQHEMIENIARWLANELEKSETETAWEGVLAKKGFEMPRGCPHGRGQVRHQGEPSHRVCHHPPHPSKGPRTENHTGTQSHS